MKNQITAKTLMGKAFTLRDNLTMSYEECQGAPTSLYIDKESARLIASQLIQLASHAKEGETICIHVRMIPKEASSMSKERTEEDEEFSQMLSRMSDTVFNILVRDDDQDNEENPDV